jgi:hypothetical protein
MEIDKLGTFWQSLAEHADLEVTLHKVRGDAHHIVESSFKAASRAAHLWMEPIRIFDGTCPSRVKAGPDRQLKEASPGSTGKCHQNKETSATAKFMVDGGCLRRNGTKC